MYQEKVNIEQGIRPTGELLTDRSFLMPKTTKSDKNEQPEIMKDQEEFYYGIFSERSRNFTDICDRTGSRYWNLEFNQGKGVKGNSGLMQLLIENLGISKRILGKSALMCYNKNCVCVKRNSPL